MIGQEIGGYKIVEVLGRGGMGVVFKAVDTALDKVVALKALDPVHAQSEQFLGRFRAEARTLGRLQHPYIVNVFAFRRVEPHLFIVMEYVEGGSLADLIAERGALPWREVLPLIQQSVEAMAYAHRVGVVHRDIKPRNVLLTREGTVKVTDFGLAKIQEDSGDSHGLTRTGITGGTLYYMPPEQLEGLNRVDHRGDIYSLGMTCYELLAGRVPFDKSKAEFTILKAIDAHSFPAIDHFAPDIPDDLARVVSRALEHDPEDRYGNADEMLDDVRRIVARADTILDDSAPAPPDTAPPDTATRVYSWAALPSDLDDPAEEAEAPRDDPDDAPGEASESVVPDSLFAPRERAGAADDARGDSSSLLKSLKLLLKDSTGNWRVKADEEAAAGEEGSPATAIASPPPKARVARDVQPAAPAPRPSRPAARPAPRRRLAPVLLGTVLVAAVAVAGFFLLPFGSVAEAPPSLSVESNPVGAVVYLDGERLGTTPLGRVEAAEGEHRLRVEQAGFAPFDTTLVLGAGEAPRFSISLTAVDAEGDLATAAPTGEDDTADAAAESVSEDESASEEEGPDEAPVAQLGNATIRSTPSNAEVWLDGRRLGTTPYTARDLAPGAYRFVVRRAGHAEGTAQVRVEAGRTATSTATLAPLPGSLRVLVRPFGDIYVGGTLKKRGTNAPHVEEVTPGAYRIRAVHPALGTWEKSVTVAPGEQREVVFNFNQTFQLTVVSEPRNAAIFVDGQATGRNTPSRITLRPGRHTISVQKNGFVMEGAPQTLSIERDRTDDPLRFQLRAR